MHETALLTKYFGLFQLGDVPPVGMSRNTTAVTAAIPSAELLSIGHLLTLFAAYYPTTLIPYVLCEVETVGLG